MQYVRDVVRVSVFNPEWDTTAWSTFPNLEGIALKYRRVADVEWSFALDKSLNRIYFSIRPPKVWKDFWWHAVEDAKPQL